MNFDFGEVFRRAWQITWKHKVLWLIAALPSLLVLVIVPVWLAVVFVAEIDPVRLNRYMDNPAFVTGFVVLYVLIIVTSIFLQVISFSSATLGIYRAETGGQPMDFASLLREGFQYFWRILGVLFLIAVVVMAFMLMFFLCMAAVSFATMGLGAICFQFVFLLLIPVFLLVMAVMEQAFAAVVADGMGVKDALTRGFDLVRAHLGKYALVAIAIYFGMNLLISLVTFPLMIPMFFLMFQGMEAEPDFNNVLRMQAAFSAVLFPILTLVQAVTLTYLKSAMIVMYLRLRPAPVEPVAQELTA